LFLKKNPDIHKSIALAGHGLFENNFTMDKTGKLLVGYLEELIEKSKSRI